MDDTPRNKVEDGGNYATPDDSSTSLPKLTPDEAARLVEFYRLLDRWDRESRTDDRPGQD